ncbi:hypothetical protein ACWCOT_14990 [Nonomuraea bangladeshensis]
MLKKILLLVLIIRSIASHNTSASTEPHPSPTKRRYRPLIVKLIAVGISVAFATGCLLWSYEQFRQISAVPRPLANEGKAEIFFDRPDLATYFAAEVDDGPRGSTPSISYVLSTAGTHLDGTHFSLYLTGAARYTEIYPNGEKMETISGCPMSVWTSPKIKITCTKATVPNDRLSLANSSHIPAQLIEGTLPITSAGNAFLQIRTVNEQAFSVTAGKRTYFSLPSIGSARLPKELRKANIGTPGDRPRFVPSDLSLVVTYSNLQPNHRIENIVPSPKPADQLMWVENDTMAIRAYGSIVDILVEERGQQQLFLIALLAGFLASLVPLQIGSAFSLIRKLRDR